MRKTLPAVAVLAVAALTLGACNKHDDAAYNDNTMADTNATAADTMTNTTVEPGTTATNPDGSTTTVSPDGATTTTSAGNTTTTTSTNTTP